MRKQAWMTLFLLLLLVLASIAPAPAFSQLGAAPVETASQTHFVIISDNHFIQPDRKDCDWCAEMYGATVTALTFIESQLKPEFVVYLGDLISGEGTIEISEQESLELTNFFRKETGAMLSVPYYAVWGNHDGPNFPKVYGYKNKAVRIGGRLFYLFGIELTSYWSGTGKFEDWDYFKKSLSDNADIPAMVFTHEPIFPPTFENGLKVKSFIEKHPRIKIVFQGHTHSEHLVKSNGVAYFTCEGFLITPNHSFYDVVLDGNQAKISRYDLKDGNYVKSCKEDSCLTLKIE
jgi:predicted phosphodiesterase